MRAHRSVAVGAAVVITAAAAWSLAQTGRAHAVGGNKLSFFIQDSKQVQLDLNTKGDQGDLFAFHGLTYDKKGGEKIGRFGGSCTILEAGHGLPADWSCNADYVLPGGQLHTEIFGDPAVLFDGKPFAFSVLGGTGRYSNARGEGTMAIPTTVKDQTDGYVKIKLIG